MLISLVIPTYNNAELLGKNIPRVVEALEAFDRSNVELIVTDNNSSDNTLEVLRDLKKDSKIPFTILENSYNGGFSVNVNRGIKASKGEVVILLGSDVKPEKDFIKPLVSHFSDDKVFAVGCANKSDQDSKENLLRGRGIGKWKRGFLLHSFGEMTQENTLWVDCGSGAFKKKILDRIGYLQELYSPFYWEDIDLSYRAQKMGFKVVVEKNSIVIHEHSKGSIKKNEKPDYITEIAFRNQFIFVWLNITDISLLISHILFFPINLLNSFKSGKLLFLKGFLRALWMLPKILKERNKITKQFVVSDHSILQNFL